VNANNRIRRHSASSVALNKVAIVSIAAHEGCLTDLVQSKHSSTNVESLVHRFNRANIERDVSGSLIRNGVVSGEPHDSEGLSLLESSHGIWARSVTAASAVGVGGRDRTRHRFLANATTSHHVVPFFDERLACVSDGSVAVTSGHVVLSATHLTVSEG